MPAISIIVPVHNGEAYLGECLDSILGQSFDDFELICVDDGSTDSSPEILERYSAFDGRMRVIRQACSGAGSARNVGMSAATGDYLLFLDADDFFLPDMFAKAIETARRSDADIVFMGGRRYDQEKSTVSSEYEFLYEGLLPDKEVFSAADAPETLFRITTPAPWSKLFKASFVEGNGLGFQNLPNSNDLFFTYSSMARAGRMIALKGDFIRYRVNTGKGTQDGKARNPLCFFEALRSWEDDLKTSGTFALLERSYVNASLSVIWYNITSTRSDTARLRILDYLLEHGEYQQELLGREEDFYKYFDTKDLWCFVKAALSQRKKLLLAENPVAARKVAGSLGMSAEPVISVVVPVFNSAQYVEQTIHSLLSQTFGDFELICVNDGSTDKTFEVLQACAERDKRIVVYDQPNQGQSVARNAAIDVARGRFLHFMDSDDLLREDAFERLADTMEKQDLDLLYFDAESFYESSDLAENHPWFQWGYKRSCAYNEIYDGAELMSLFCRHGDYVQSPCMYLIRREILEKTAIRFHPGILHEDNAFTFEVGLAARRAAHLHEALYRRRVRDGSTMTTPVSFSKTYGYFACGEDMLRAYFQVEKRLKPEERSSLRALIAQVMQNSRDLYTKMSCDLRGSEYGLGYDREAFHREIAIEAMGCANMQAALDGHEAYLASVRRMPLRPLAGWVKRRIKSLGAK